MAGEPHITISSNADRGSAEASHRDARFMKRGDTRQHRSPKGGSRWWCEGAAREDRRQWRAFVGLYRDPDAVRVGAPREHGRERWMLVVGKSLKARDRCGGLSRRHWNLVDHHGLATLEHGLPPLARPRRHEFDQLRFRLALRHYGCMVPLGTVAYVIVQPCVGVKDASCVEVCPVDCIHTDDAATMYYIDPDECIDCGACVDPCPVDAIFPEDEVPEQWRDFIKINADYFKNR
jgi:NAD-dependent dihydropyrimidine dehydrogenase PreA subunit